MGLAVFMAYACGLGSWVLDKYRAWRARRSGIKEPGDETSRVALQETPKEDSSANQKPKLSALNVDFDAIENRLPPPQKSPEAV